MIQTNELTAFSTFYNEQMTESEYKNWSANDCEKEYYALKNEGDTAGAAFMQQLGAKKGLVIDGGYNIAQVNQDIYEQCKSIVNACMGKI